MSQELKPLIAKLNHTSRKAFEQAAQFCVAQTHYSVEIEHLLLKLLERADTDTDAILRYYDVSIPKLKGELTRAVEQFKRGNERTPAMSPYIVSLLREAWLISSLHFAGHLIRSGALLLAIVDDETLRGTLIEALPSLLNIPRDSLRDNLRELVQYSSEAKAPTLETENTSLTAPKNSAESDSSPLTMSSTPALDQYTLDLTAQARSGEIDPIVGRDNEIRQIIDILTRRRQNNPILTGDAGVGKTAVVEGFALSIVKGEVPPSLRKVAVKTLDLGLLQAGAGVRGEFENRLKSVINEVKASPQPIILFIDEAHTLIGAGGQAGQGDAANLLKPALARGELRTIAATTWAEYKKYFEKDHALTRRFQVIKVDEPSEEIAIIMLRSVIANLEQHHQVRIMDDAVREAVRLSHRYISGRQLPDKAISVLDTACARVSIAQNSIPPKLETTLRRISHCQEELRLLQREQTTGCDHAQRIQLLNQELNQLDVLQHQLEQRWQEELEQVKRCRELEAALEKTLEGDRVKVESEPDLRAALDDVKQAITDIQGEDPMVPTHVDGHIIALVISGWTGIPVGKMLINEIVTTLNLKEKMAARLVGQPYALDTITRRIQTYHANLDDPGKPMGVFLLVGPSGVGKTETAVTLAELLYGGEHHIITVNMSEYQEAHTVSSLKGAPPGYVGYGSGGVLTEAVRRNPYSVVLLDEIEKAHPDVMELFYQVFDKGTLEDGEGLVVDFKNTLILLTTNIGSEAIMSLCRQNAELPRAEAIQQAIRPFLRRYFKAAFLGRLVIVPYHPLGDEDIRQIVRLKMTKIQQRFKENHHAQLTFDENLVTTIVNRCTEVDTGARNVDHILTDTILPALSVEILERMAKGQGFSAVHLSCDEQVETRFI
ncbi:MAG TPA: type VI secretion system ATPase TssH [Gammaproteobacteria bacterium]|nr:type VI secretion system ATPase TssH [Gammaproteobacteria bacterium]